MGRSSWPRISPMISSFAIAYIGILTNARRDPGSRVSDSSGTSSSTAESIAITSARVPACTRRLPIGGINRRNAVKNTRDTVNASPPSMLIDARRVIINDPLGQHAYQPRWCFIASECSDFASFRVARCTLDNQLRKKYNR